MFKTSTFRNLPRLNPSTCRWVWWLLLLVGIVPIVMALKFTCIIPRSDHWNVICQPYIQTTDGGSMWEFLHSPGNDSRHNAPKLLHLALIKFTGWNLVYESLICVVLGICTCALLNSLWRRHSGIGSTERWCLALVCTLLLLSPMQWMNWAWGIQICYMLNVFCTLAVVWIFSLGEESLLARTLWAGLLAVVASFSFVNGLLTWGFGIIFLLQADARQHWRSRPFLLASAIWIGLATLTVTVYCTGWPSGKSLGASGAADLAKSNPLQLVLYGCKLLGAPSGQFAFFDKRYQLQQSLDFTTPIIGSALLLTAFLVAFRCLKMPARVPWSALLPWIVITLWGLANVAAIAYARIGMVHFSPYQSRYPSLSLWLDIGLLGLLAYFPGKFYQGLRWAWVALFLTGGVFAAIQGWNDAAGQARQNSQLEAAVVLRHVAPEPILLDGVMPQGQQQIVPMLDRLDKLGILQVPTFSSALVSDAVRGPDDEYRGRFTTATPTKNGPRFRGWALHRTTRKPAPAVLISMQSGDQPERWIGIASALKRDPIHSKKYRAKASNERIGWAYEPLTGKETCFMSTTPISTQRNPLPPGRAIFRAWVLNPSTGEVYRIPGERTLTLR